MNVIKKSFMLFAFCCFVLGSSSLFAETWKITSLDWQPYSGSDMTNKGKSIQKLQTLLKAQGIDLVVEFYPWKRAQALAGQKDYVGYFPAWPEEVYSGFIASDPIDWSNLGALVASDSAIKWTTIDDLFKNNKVGIIETYAYPDYIQAAIKKYPNNVDKSPDETILLKKLSMKRIDAGLTDPDVTLYLAQKENITNIKVLNKSIEKKALVIAFRAGEDNKKRIELINKLLKK